MYDAYWAVRVVGREADCPELPIAVHARHAKAAVGLGTGTLPPDTEIPVL
jgi:hypothetical protein